MSTVTFACPLGDWTHTADHDPDKPELAAVTELAIREHGDTHSTDEWMNAVAALRQQIAQLSAASVCCLGCFMTRHNAMRAGVPPEELPQLKIMQLIVDGKGMCFDHVNVSDGPLLPDRSAGGIILPPGAMPPQNPPSN
jgi:hypothetical protein